LRGKPWSVDEERQLSGFAEAIKNSEEISQIMSKSRVSVKAKLCNLSLSVVVAAGQKCAVASASASASSRSSVGLKLCNLGLSSVVVTAGLGSPQI
jgi:hypothetical protein